MKQYTIPNPCPEKWESFVPGEGAAFCKVCATDVVDFTHMTEEEIKAYFQQSTGSLCGRFSQKQIENNPRQVSLKTNIRLKGAAALLGGISFLPLTAVSQEVDVPNIKKEDRVEVIENQGDSLVFYGKVMENDSSGLEIIGANIIVAGTTIGTSTDINGNFNIKINKQDLKSDTVLLIFSFIGFGDDSLEVEVNSRKSIEYNSVLSRREDQTIIGIVAPKKHLPGRIWSNMKFSFYRLFAKD